jgi:pimeloyl-ACP methyl ester carboxylesterase
MASMGITVVLVHGFLSSARTWDAFAGLLTHDVELTSVRSETFEYASPLVSLNPARRIPDLDDIADNLATYLTHDLADRPHLVLVTHSQGGLVVQRYLARTLRAAHGRDLSRIRRVVMFACPNAGSAFLLPARRFFRHPQEVDLRPINRAITEAQEVVLHRVIGASEATDTTWPIPVVAYAGDQDDIVPPASAKSVFTDTGVLPGDHFTIIQPDGPHHRSYVALKSNLQSALSDAAALHNSTAVPAPRADPPAVTVTVTPVESPPADPATVLTRILGPGRNGTLVDALLEVPGMTEPDFRRRAYEGLPRPVLTQVERDSRAQVELVSLVEVCARLGHLNPWRGLLARLNELLPHDPAVHRLAATLVDHRMIDLS